MTEKENANRQPETDPKTDAVPAAGTQEGSSAETKQADAAGRKRKPGFPLKRKKLWITIFILIAIAVVAIVTGLYMAQKRKAASSKSSTDKVVTTDLQSGISATGTLESKTETNVAAKMSGTASMKIASVDVEVGDTVKAGDKLATFDVSDAQQNLSDAQSNLNSEKATKNANKNAAQKGYDDAVKSRNAQLKSARTQISSARDTLSSARKTYRSAKNSVSSAKSRVNRLKNRQKKASAMQQAQITQDLASAQTQLASAKSARASAKSAYEQAKSAYKQAQAAYDTTVASTDTAVDQAQAQVDQANAQEGSSSAQSQVRTYQQIVDNATLTSPVSGTVVAVNAKANTTYSGGTMVVIADTSNLYITADIDEADISDVTNGMKVLIKTDATGSSELEGTVTKIAPSAESDTSSSDASASAAAGAMSGMSSMMGTASTGQTSSGGASYQVRVELKQQNTRLKIGMTGKLSLIKNEADHVLAVPYDALYTNSKGQKVLHQVIDKSKSADDKNNIKEIPVQTGLESGYYVQIKSGKGVRNGMTIQVPDSSHKATVEEAFQGMSATGGME